MIAQSESPVVEVRELSKRYGSTLACDSLNLSVRQGMTFGLLGPNGAGKSTLIRMLMGLTPVDSGEVLLFGENANDRRKKPVMYRLRTSLLPPEESIDYASLPYF